MRATTRKRWQWTSLGAVSAVLIAAVLAWPSERAEGTTAPAPMPTQASTPSAPDPVPSRAPVRDAPSAPAAAPVPVPDASAAEDQNIVQLRNDVDERPLVALQLASDGDARFPTGQHAPERAYLKMRALVHVGDISAARDAAAEFFVHHRRSPFAQYVWRLTGVRPRPSPFAE